MKNLKKLFLLAIIAGSLLLSGCFNIIEEITFKNNGSGTYSMIMDMGEMKSMMEMFKNMNPDAAEGEATEGMEQDVNSEDVVVEEDSTPPPPMEENEGGMSEDNPGDMSQMGEQLTGGVKKSLEGVAGITNVVEINDTTIYKFGYTFDFASVDALNKAIKIINKEKYDAKADETFKFSGKKFERTGAANIGAELKKALSEGGGEEGGDESMDMLKNFFADMSYTQIYHFPDRVVKKSTNSLTELSDGGHTLTIANKPFSEDEAMKKAGIDRMDDTTKRLR